MVRPRHVTRTCLAAALWGAGMMAGGCAHHHAAEAGVRDPQRSRLASKREQSTGAPQQSVAKLGDPARVSFASSSTGAQAQPSDTPAGPGSNQPSVAQASMQNYARNASPDQFTGLQLYGAVPGDQSRGLSSPMDGSDTIRRVSFTTEGGDFDPDVDPTGQWLVYASTRHRQTSDLYLKRVDGAAVTQLTGDPANEVMPAFSPDGKRVAFASDRSGNWDIYIIDIQGGQPVQITNSPAHEIHPSFSPDGTKLVFSALGQQSGQWELVVVDVDNPATKRFVGYGLFPKWSPVDNRIVFQRARERGTRWFSVWTIELDPSGEARRPTEIAAASNAACITPSWSPDGKHVVFCTVVNPESGETTRTRPEQADVWIVSADGRHRANLTQSRFSNLQPVWGPDGSVYFVSDRGQSGVENVWALRPDYVVQMAQPREPAAAPTAQAPTP